MRVKLDISTYVSGIEPVSATIAFNISTDKDSYRISCHITTGGRISLTEVFYDVRKKVNDIFKSFKFVNRKSLADARKEVLWQCDTAINRAVEGCLRGTSYSENRICLYTVIGKGEA